MKAEKHPIAGPSRHGPNCPATRDDIRDLEGRVLQALALIVSHLFRERCEAKDVLDKLLEREKKETKKLEKLTKS